MVERQHMPRHIHLDAHLLIRAVDERGDHLASIPTLHMVELISIRAREQRAHAVDDAARVALERRKRGLDIVYAVAEREGQTEAVENGAA